ncbi:MAG: hypothetical protein Q4P22_02105 [Eubacteriales bacterium]|nr:hypothetical protein [Eubacteriales bacterium]
MSKVTEDERKRAENLIWTAAGSYDFSPDFCSFNDDGSADVYMNIVIGLEHKWLGERTDKLLKEAAESRRAAILTDTLWLGIESYVYAKEVAVRPVLTELRRKHAGEYFERLKNLNRQQWMAENKQLLDQQTIRWSRVLGKEKKIYAPDRKALAAALELSPSLSADEAADKLMGILVRFFAFKGGDKERPRSVKLKAGEAWILKHVFKTEHRHTDTVMMKNSFDGSATEGGTASKDDKHSSTHQSGDRAYIEACFGRSLYNDEELKRIESRLCVGVHRACRVFVTDGRMSEDKALSQESIKIRNDSARQELLNRRYMQSEGSLPISMVRRLSARLEVVLAELRQNIAVNAAAGRLNASRSWRMPILSDTEVFTKNRAERELPIDVTVLLDASASRMQVQEQLAAEVWILAEALKRCHVSSQVLSFRSLRGYTILERMKAFKDNDTSGFFGFYAAGWNRDGLGLRLAADELLRANNGRKHILIVLTDASPDDSERIAAGGKYPIGTAYEGAAAIEDTAEAAAEIRKNGILIYGLFLGRTDNIENLHRIYGKDQVRIHDISQFAKACGELFVKAVNEL